MQHHTVQVKLESLLKTLIARSLKLVPCRLPQLRYCLFNNISNNGNKHVIVFMLGIYTHISETKHFPMENGTVAIM